MKYSIIIPYRNREEHLSILIPSLKKAFDGKEYEIVVAEQDNNEKFRLSMLYNVAFGYTKGEQVIFHDVDYIPSDTVVYDMPDDNPYYPVKQVVFLAEDNATPKRLEDIPAGYRHFHMDVGNHSGGVYVMKREVFEKLNGLNPLYVGWGKDDDDMRARIARLGLKQVRGNGLFYALHHPDSGPSPTDPDFQRNEEIFSHWWDFVGDGYRQSKADVVVMHPSDEEWNIVRWLRMTNFRVENK